MQRRRDGSETLLYVIVEAAVQRVLVLYTASRVTWVSALPGSAAAVEEKESWKTYKRERGVNVPGVC